jgi:hypothetical protein
MSAISWILLCLVLLLVIAILAALLIPVSRR